MDKPLIRIFPTLQKVISQMGIKNRDCHPDLPGGKVFRQLNLGGGAISLEEALFLCGIVSVFRPHYIIELGTSKGASALCFGAIAKDCNKNDTSRFINVETVDYDTNFNNSETARSIAKKYSLPINFINGWSSIDYLNGACFPKALRHLFFSDTDIPIRPDEINLINEVAPKGSLVVVHDTSDNHPYGPMNLKEKLNFTPNIINFPSPRGITLIEI